MFRFRLRFRPKLEWKPKFGFGSVSAIKIGFGRSLNSIPTPMVYIEAWFLKFTSFVAVVCLAFNHPIFLYKHFKYKHKTSNFRKKIKTFYCLSNKFHLKSLQHGFDFIEMFTRWLLLLKCILLFRFILYQRVWFRRTLYRY